MIMHFIDRLVLAMRMTFPAPDHSIRQMRGGYRMELRPGADPHERQLYYRKTYEPATLSLFDRVLRPGDTVVDVGANLGLMTLHAALRVGPTGTVVAIEPHPFCFRRLVRNVALNDLGNVRPVQVAAGAVPERRTIYDFPAVNIGRSSLIPASLESKPAGEVSVNRLDTILAEIGIGDVRLLKIDVEGFELEVLKGAVDTLARQPVICMEVTSALSHGAGGTLGAHDLIMSSGLYSSYNFLFGKERASPLVEISDRSRLERQVHDNVVYIPHTLRSAFPRGLFA